MHKQVPYAHIHYAFPFCRDKRTKRPPAHIYPQNFETFILTAIKDWYRAGEESTPQIKFEMKRWAYYEHDAWAKISAAGECQSDMPKRPIHRAPNTSKIHEDKTGVETVDSLMIRLLSPSPIDNN